MRLRLRVFLAIFALSVTGGTLFLRWVLDDLRSRYLEAVEENLVDTANLLASLLEATSPSPDSLVSPAAARGLEAVRDRRFEARIYQLVKTSVDLRIYVTDSVGRVVFDTRPGGGDVGADYSRWHDVRRTLDGLYGARTTRRDPELETSSTLHVAAPVRRNGRIVGVVSVAKPSQSINLFLEMARPKIVIAALLAALGIVVAGWLTSLWLVRPIQRLSAHARAVRDGASPALPDLGASEVRELGQAFEEMRRAVEGRHYVEEYVHALTHELKSPLTAIQAASEILADDPPPETRQRFLHNIRTESVRMRDTVERLLELSSLEGRSVLRDAETIDLAAMARSLAEAFASVADPRRVAIRVEGAATCRGEAFLVERAVRNLVANALDFSPDDAAVEIVLAQLESRASIEVSDRGPGIPDFARERVFERFYSLPRPGGGRKSSGLGLPFVREVARLHGGSIALAARDGGGTVARLSL